MRMNFLFPVSWVSLRWQGGQAKRPILFMFVGVILAMLVFILDMMMPPDSVISLAYPAVVLVGLIARSILAVGLFAALATMLTIGGYFISPAPIAPLATVLLNHLLAICAIWLTAGLSYFYLRSMLTLQPLAERDQLTGAYNRHYLLEKAREQIEMGRRYQMPLSLILLDFSWTLTILKTSMTPTAIVQEIMSLNIWLNCCNSIPVTWILSAAMGARNL